ncbi:MAG: hypothetical protein ABI759_09560 [Candidatus Solibacter sp.]
MKFLSATLLCILGCAAAYGAFVYYVNPRGEFAPAIFPRVLMPDREAKLRLYQDFARRGPATGLVLGSSRSMKLPPPDLNRLFGARFFNFGVTGATVEDFAALYAWARQRGAAPRYVIVGVDVDSLHSDDQYGSTLAVPELRVALEGKAGLTTVERAAFALGQAQDVYKLGYLLDSFHAIGLKFQPVPPRWSFDPDGYVRYRLSEHERATNTFDYPKAMGDCAVRYQKRYHEMTGLSTRRRSHLENLVARARHDGAKVILWLTPIHPQTLPDVARGTKYPELLEQTRSFLETLHDRYGASVFDLHDPARYGAAGGYWYDCVHFDEPAAERILAVLAEAR